MDNNNNSNNNIVNNKEPRKKSSIVFLTVALVNLLLFIPGVIGVGILYVLFDSFIIKNIQVFGVTFGFTSAYICMSITGLLMSIINFALNSKILISSIIIVIISAVFGFILPFLFL